MECASGEHTAVLSVCVLLLVICSCDRDQRVHISVVACIIMVFGVVMASLSRDGANAQQPKSPRWTRVHYRHPPVAPRTVEGYVNGTTPVVPVFEEGPQVVSTECSEHYMPQVYQCGPRFHGAAPPLAYQSNEEQFPPPPPTATNYGRFGYGRIRGDGGRVTPGIPTNHGLPVNHRKSYTLR